METKFAIKEFEGYTHRFKVQFETGDLYCSNLDFYSNSDSYQKLVDFINEKKSNKVLSFDVIHRSTKEQDERISELIDDFIS